MLIQKADISHYWESVVFTVLFLICLGAFTSSSDASIGTDSQSFSLTNQQSGFAAINNSQQVSCDYIFFRFFRKTDFKLNNTNTKIIAYFRLIHHRIAFLKQEELFIRPILLSRFYLQYHSIDTGDRPVLS